MSISRFYIRNFVIIVLIVIAAQITIGAVFRIKLMSEKNSNFMRQIKVIAFLLRENDKAMANIEYSEYAVFLQRLSDMWDVDIWLEDCRGNLLAASTPEKNTLSNRLPKDFNVHGIYGLDEKTPHRTLAVISYDSKKIFYIMSKYDYGFMSGGFYFLLILVIITVVVLIVILLILSRMIRQSFDRLIEVTEAISKGDFSKRLEGRSLGITDGMTGSFNIMTDKVQQMIEGTKTLTANVSHQIRSPLARIAVSVDILRKKIKGSGLTGTGKIFKSIDTEIENLVILTEKIVEFIYVDTALSLNNYEELSITDIVKSTASAFQDMMRSKGISYTAGYGKAPVMIHGINIDLKELFDILFDNAIRYSPENGSIKCTISDNKEEIFIDFINEADKLSNEAIDKIFNPFQRFTSENISGNGLGLAIAHGIVGKHGGTITAQSYGGLFVIKIVLKKFFK